MDCARIQELLRPFLEVPLDDSRLRHISIYIDLLLRWNARINLTAVRDPEQIVTRHFGESLFAARRLFPDAAGPAGTQVTDVGSGAGFPGLPIKMWAPPVHLTLIESNGKKASFLKEVCRALTLTYVNVSSGRAEDSPAASADLVTLRAVERFAAALPVAERLLTAGGRMALLIGETQVALARGIAPHFKWSEPELIPLSSSRVLLVGQLR